MCSTGSAPESRGELRKGAGVQVHSAVLATELRRRKVGPRAMVDALATVNESTWVLGELRSAPTSLLVLAAMSLTSHTSTGSAGPSSTR